ncbi:uncharacterized protein LOC143217689 [Lasioglossum baleicum]|uniref:uncharacterized protein LOC143217689 n=1 Tax=Lasioglossum baleicum TaxID=434251 RepID=UPI003FCDF2C3
MDITPTPTEIEDDVNRQKPLTGAGTKRPHNSTEDDSLSKKKDTAKAPINQENSIPIKSLLHTIVKWEKIIKKDRIQCMRCQRIGHVAQNCNLNYRCVKCEHDHNPGECPRSADSQTENADSPPYCVNCKTHGHPASYRGCPKLKELKERIESKRLATQLEKETIHTFTSNFIKPYKSFSQINNSSNVSITNNIKTITHQTLKIIELNVNSLISNEKRASLSEFLEVHEPDAVLLCETKLNDRYRVNFKNYIFIRSDRPNSKRGGGTGILIRDNIKFKTVQTNSSNSSNLESTAIEIKINQSRLFLIAVYSPGSNNKEFTADLTTIRDLNAKHTDWHNNTNNNRGSSLKRWLLNNQIQNRVSLLNTASPSYPKSGSFIDICLADNRIKFYNQPTPGRLKTLDFDSDHKATEIIISLLPNNQMIIEVPPTNIIYNYKIITNANINMNEAQIDEDDNIRITDINDKLNVLGAHFEKAHTQNKNMGKQQLSNIINQKILKLKTEIDEDIRNDNTVCIFSNDNRADNPNPNSIPPNYFTSTFELTQILKNLNNKKSASYDNIPNIILKHLPPVYTHNYAILFNNCLNRMHFPSAWKTAKVIALKKKGKNSNDPASYRPISLLPNISKIFEITINNAIEHFSSTNNLIPETQFGFRRRHSTIHAIAKFTADICWARNAGDCVGAIFIDLEKAFDTVWLDGLFFKLIKKNFPPHLIKMLWSMTHNKTFKVSEGQNSSSIVFTVQNGLQQGAVNSPILFSLYLSDLLIMFNLKEDNRKGAIAYADDLLSYIIDNRPSIIKKKLQELFDKIQDYFHTWKLKINVNKCETILFRPTLSKNSDANNDVRTNAKLFHIQDNRDTNLKIPHKKVVRYLGVYSDFKLHFNEHVQIQIEKAQKAVAANKRIFYSKYLDKEVKLLCYKLLIRPILTYGIPIWYNISASTMEKIRLFERRCLRACLNAYKTPKSNYTKYYSNHALLK